MVLAGAQVPVVTPGPDAGLLPRNSWRLRVTTEWTRFDSFFDDAVTGSSTGTRRLDAALRSGTLGVAQIPSLASAQSALRAFTGRPDDIVSLGNLAVAADSRIVVTPMSLEYGLTQRISLSVTMPFVQTRSTVIAQLNAQGAAGNLGANDGTSITANADVVRSAFASASTSITAALAQCATSPSQPVCSRQQEAAALAAATQAYANAIGTLYGSVDAPSIFVPVAGTNVMSAAAAHQLALNAQYRSFFGTDISNTALGGTGIPAGMNQLQGYLRTQGFGNRRDSLGTVEHLSVGDIELGAGFRLQDNFGDTTQQQPGFRSRVAVRGGVRFPTGLVASTGLPYEIGTGGRFDVEGQLAADLRWSRWIAASVNAHYVLPIGEKTVPFVPNPVNRFAVATPIAGTWKPGNIAAATVSPHVTLSDFFALNGYYSVVRMGSDVYTYDPAGSIVAPSPELVAALGPGYTTPATLEQRVGFGFSYSTIGQYARGRRPLPIEMRWVHQQTISGSGGVVPASRRDQVQIRIFYQH